MADPDEVRKITELEKLTSPARKDTLLINDISEADQSKVTKIIELEKIPVYDSGQLGDGIVSLAKLAEEVTNAMGRNLIYIQLFSASDVIVSTSGKEQFFVPSYLAGKKVKKLGLGVVTAGSTNTTVTFGAIGSVAGNGYAEGSAINVSLPETGTKIPVNVTAGSGNPKGLAFWFEVG